MAFLGAVEKARVSPFEGGSDSRLVKPANKHLLREGGQHTLTPLHRGSPAAPVKPEHSGP
jgi:hypothetical protein